MSLWNLEWRGLWAVMIKYFIVSKFCFDSVFVLGKLKVIDIKWEEGNVPKLSHYGVNFSFISLNKPPYVI